MISITCKEMKAMDSYAINSIEIPSIVLMENAALKTVKNIDLDKKNSFTIVCGVGNNGGDGLAVARHLFLEGKDVDLFIIGNLDKGTTDFKVNLNILKNLDLKTINIKSQDKLDMLKKSLLKSDMVIDAIFGIGLTRAVAGIYAETIDFINKYSKETLSLDIPSGLDGDSGEVLGLAVKADKTVTFHLIKKGLLKGEEYAGQIIVETIGIPKQATDYVLNR